MKRASEFHAASESFNFWTYHYYYGVNRGIRPIKQLAASVKVSSIWALSMPSQVACCIWANKCNLRKKPGFFLCQLAIAWFIVSQQNTTAPPFTCCDVGDGWGYSGRQQQAVPCRAATEARRERPLTATPTLLPASSAALTQDAWIRTLIPDMRCRAKWLPIPERSQIHLLILHGSILWRGRSSPYSIYSILISRSEHTYLPVLAKQLKEFIVRFQSLNISRSLIKHPILIIIPIKRHTRHCTALDFLNLTFHTALESIL